MFGDTIIALNKGATVAQLNEEICKLIHAVRATAKSGSITLALKITPGAKGNADMVFIEPDIKVKLPVEPKGSTLFFTTEDDRLTRYDERQREMDFEAPVDVKVVEHGPVADPIRNVTVMTPQQVKEAM